MTALRLSDAPAQEQSACSWTWSPDISMPIFARGTLLGIVGVRYTFEFGAVTNFEGRTLALSFTLAKLSAKLNAY